MVSRASWASWPKSISGAGMLTLRPCWPILAWRTCAALPGASTMWLPMATTYRPAIDGETAHAALIVPAVEDGRIVDLVACTVVAAAHEIPIWRRCHCRL